MTKVINTQNLQMKSMQNIQDNEHLYRQNIIFVYQ